MKMVATMNALEAIYNTPGEPGIVLRVLRPASDSSDPEAGAGTVIVIDADASENRLMSDRFAELILAGVVDYSGIRREKPIISPLPNVPEVVISPLVWLVRGFRDPSNRYLVEANKDGSPNLGSMRHGGNFAVGSDFAFGELVGEYYGAVPIFDRPVKNGDRTKWGM